MIAIQYSRNFAIGKSSHIVKVYAAYDDAIGLIDEIESIDSSKITDCVKVMKNNGASDIQVKNIRQLAKDRSDGIILFDGSFKQW